VESWLATLDPRVIDRWVAYRLVEQSPLDRIVGILVHGFQLLIASFAGGELAEEDQIDFPFGNKREVEKADGTMSANDQVKMLRMSKHG